MITVKRSNVLRMVPRELADGTTNVIEGVEFRATCGCLVVFGARMDNNEHTCGYSPCDGHRPRATEFLSRFTGEDSPAIESGKWMARLLNEMHPLG